MCSVTKNKLFYCEKFNTSNFNVSFTKHKILNNIFKYKVKSTNKSHDNVFVKIRIFYRKKKVSRNLESKTIIYSPYHLFAVAYRSFHCISSPESVSIIYSGWPGQLHLSQLDFLENKTLRPGRVRWYRVVYFAVNIIINSKSIYISKEVLKMSCYSQWYEYKLFITTLLLGLGYKTAA